MGKDPLPRKTYRQRIPITLTPEVDIRVDPRYNIRRNGGRGGDGGGGGGSGGRRLPPDAPREARIALNHLKGVKRIEPFRTKVELDGHWPSPLNQKFFKAMDKRVENRILTYPT